MSDRPIITNHNLPHNFHSNYYPVNTTSNDLLLDHEYENNDGSSPCITHSTVVKNLRHTNTNFKSEDEITNFNEMDAITLSPDSDSKTSASRTSSGQKPGGGSSKTSSKHNSSSHLNKILVNSHSLPSNLSDFEHSAIIENACKVLNNYSNTIEEVDEENIEVNQEEIELLTKNSSLPPKVSSTEIVVEEETEGQIEEGTENVAETPETTPEPVIETSDASGELELGSGQSTPQNPVLTNPNTSPVSKISIKKLKTENNPEPQEEESSSEIEFIDDVDDDSNQSLSIWGLKA